MNTVIATRIWQMTLASKLSADPQSAAREKLRVSFMSFRERAAQLAAEIHRDLPEFTVHDITHLDALWEIADIVGGPELSLTPPEAFVLGGAFLLHDLGMSIASYPQGLEELKQRQSWNDTITLQFMEKHKRHPTTEELANPPHDAVTAATAYLLRALHAEQAERLGMAAWTVPGTDSTEYLIQDADIRQIYGRIVGLIAHSHWWPIEELETRFSRTLGAPHWCPKEWTVDPLKVSCLLRVSDAGHIDARRAPYFLRAIRHISAASAEHWAFQQRIGKPHLIGDALSYTSGYAFPFTESASWWLCFDALRMVDCELRAVDAMLADKGIPRFAARRIAGIESPERLISYVPTAGWSPVDASIQVSDVPRLLMSLGGRELYGKNPRVSLRELIQNASDAVRARGAIENRSTDWGKITVRLGQDGDKYWLEVEDTGIGMSRLVLTKYLLDFSTTFWGSSAMIDELPGLLGSGFRPTGKYGIGFFSVFMLGDSVKVQTRRADAAQRDTLILEFNTGLSSRPVLREAAIGEVLRDGGTTVRVWLQNDPFKDDGLLWRYGKNTPASLADICREMCPALPIRLVCEDRGTTSLVLSGDDWQNCPGQELFTRTRRLNEYGGDEDEYDNAEFLEKASENLRILYNSDDFPVGRACIGLFERDRKSKFHSANLYGVVTVGGLNSCRLYGIAGVLIGISERAARDYSIPIVSASSLANWASEQALLVSRMYKSPDDQMECASIIRRCGGNTAKLPIAQYEGRYLSAEDISAMDLPDVVYILNPYRISDIQELRNFKLIPGVFVAGYQAWVSILQSREFSHWPDRLFTQRPLSVFSTLGGIVIESVAKAWGCTVDSLEHDVTNQTNSQENQIIGYLDGQEIKQEVLVLKKSWIRKSAEA